MIESSGGVLYLVVCAADAAEDVGRLVALAQDEGWVVQVVATPSALDFIDVGELERRTGRPVRSRYRKPHEPKPPRADAIIVAPATYNTINKFASGVADTYALGVLAEAPGLGIPVVALPFVNSALAARTPFRRSVEDLRADGCGWCSTPITPRVTPGNGRWPSSEDLRLTPCEAVCQGCRI